jgi:hypothetical protein
MADSRIYTRRQIENLIAAGQTIIIFQNHMIGRDATAEIDA